MMERGERIQLSDAVPDNHSTSIDYELLVKSVYQAILRQEGVENIEVLHDQKIKGKSGVSHQIDVLWRFLRAGIEHLVIVECKNYGKSVELGDVRNFHGVVEDIKGAQGVMVSKVGFQSGATDFAKHYGIGLKLFRPPIEEDWEGYIKDVNVFISIRSFDLKRQPSMNFMVPKEFGSKVIGATPKGLGIEVQLLDRAGSPKTPPMRQWLDQVVPVVYQTAGGPYTHKVPLVDTYLLFENSVNKEEFLVPVESVDIIYYVSEYQVNVSVAADQVVKYVLKDFITGEVERFHRD
jgi:hypothetical protein